MIKDLFSSFLNQGILGLIVIVAIVALAVYGIIKSIALRNIYRDLNNTFEKSNILDDNTLEKNLEGNILGEIVDDFKRSAGRGTDNINTEVLILKHLRNYGDFSEKTINMIPAISIALGLLGTFLGLSLAIHSTNGVLTSGVNSMEIFLDKMGLPLQGMASAFWTSIFGVIASIKVNYINSFAKKEKEKFFDSFEDYLDNTVYGENFYGFAKQFEKFNETLSNTMRDLTLEMRNLFREGVEELVSNINKNTLDMTETAKEMSNYTSELNRVIISLDKTVDSFKVPVDRFKSSIDEFRLTTEKLDYIMSESTEKLSDKIEGLGDNISSLERGIDNENKIMLMSVDYLREVQDNLNNTYKKVIESTDNIKEAINISGDKLDIQLSNLTEGYDRFENGFDEFINTLGLLKESLSENVSSLLKDEFLNLSDGIVENLTTTIDKVAEATMSLSKNTDTIAKLVKATNEWVSVTK